MMVIAHGGAPTFDCPFFAKLLKLRHWYIVGEQGEGIGTKVLET